MITKLLVGILIGAGMYFILADLFRVPYIKTSRAVRNLQKSQTEKTSSIDIWLGNIAGFIAKHLPMNEYRKQELEQDLRTAQMEISPEMFVANAITKALIIGIFAIPVYFVFPVLSPVILFLAIILYRMSVRSVTVKIRAKRARIENDLPRMVNTISKKLDYNRSILDILRDFAPNAGPELRHELEITIADIVSGNEESAITRLDGRVGSSMMSDVCRGFATMIHGDTAKVYWSSLAIKFADIRRQRLKIEAEKMPRKVRRLSMCLLVCFMLIYVVVIIAQIADSMGILFS